MSSCICVLYILAYKNCIAIHMLVQHYFYNWYLAPLYNMLPTSTSISTSIHAHNYKKISDETLHYLNKVNCALWEHIFKRPNLLYLSLQGLRNRHWYQFFNLWKKFLLVWSSEKINQCIPVVFPQFEKIQDWLSYYWYHQYLSVSLTTQCKTHLVWLTLYTSEYFEYSCRFVVISVSGSHTWLQCTEAGCYL